MKRMFLPKHAQERALQRNVPPKDIERTILDPDLILPTFNKRRKRASKKIGDRIIDVIYVETEHQYIVVTVIPLEKRFGEVKK